MDYRHERTKNIIDGRGQLTVFLRKNDLLPSRRSFGQIYFVTFDKKGVVRGNHYHKRWREWFGVVTGSVRVYLQDVRTHEKRSFVLSAGKRHFYRLQIGPYIAHAFKSLTSKAALLNYGDAPWSQDDRYVHALIKTDEVMLRSTL
jgi:dTDP-4-dehydrorhamnose 3,5-epimerase-like enzyme